MLPEIPDDKEPCFLEQNPLNPCGVANVVMLQNLPWHGNVLMSLTSCRVLVDGSVFPVEPKPSTFAVSFTDESPHMTELDIMFDFSAANTRWKKLATEAKNRRGEVHENSALPSNHSGYSMEDQSFVQDWIQHSRPDHQIFLSHLQAMAEKEAHDLDRILGILGIVGAVLLGLLLWSGYRLSESSKMGSRRSLEFHKLLQRKQKILLEHSTMTNHPEPPSQQSAEVIAKQEEQHFHASRLSCDKNGAIENRDLGRVVVVDQRPPLRLVLLLTSLSIKRDQVANQKLMQTILESQEFLEVDLLDGADPQHKLRRNELFEISGLRANYPQLFVMAGTKVRFVGDLERVQQLNDNGLLTHAELLDDEKMQGAHELSSFLENTLPAPSETRRETYLPCPMTPPSREGAMRSYVSPPLSGAETTTSIEDDDDDDVDSIASSSSGAAPSTSEASTSSGSSELSPCSKLAREWAERKSERRSQRRAMQAKLRPLAIQWNTGEAVMFGKTASITTMKQMEQPHEFTEGKDVANHSDLLPLQHGILETDSSTDNGEQVQSLKLTPLLPDLVCSTPGSKEQSSFVDDYW